MTRFTPPKDILHQHTPWITVPLALETQGRGHGGSYFLWLSVKVMPCAETLKWTMVAVGVGSATNVSATAFAMAWGPVSDSISTELMKRTLQAGKGDSRHGVNHCSKLHWPHDSPSLLTRALFEEVCG